ncbi:uncharacterized protein LOC122261825, partial [Penaeus japonicus]
MPLSRRQLISSLCFVTGRCARKAYGLVLLMALCIIFYSLFLEGISDKRVERSSSPSQMVSEDVLEDDVTPTAKNVTPEHTRLLIYNRVPKCGSTTTFKLLNT